MLIEVEDSNAFAPGSWWRYQAEPVGSGSRVRFQFDRRPKNLKGRIWCRRCSASAGKRVFTRSLEETLRRLGAAAPACRRMMGARTADDRPRAAASIFATSNFRICMTAAITRLAFF